MTNTNHKFVPLRSSNWFTIIFDGQSKALPAGCPMYGEHTGDANLHQARHVKFLTWTLQFIFVPLSPLKVMNWGTCCPITIKDDEMGDLEMHVVHLSISLSEHDHQQHYSLADSPPSFCHLKHWMMMNTCPRPSKSFLRSSTTNGWHMLLKAPRLTPKDGHHHQHYNSWGVSPPAADTHYLKLDHSPKDEHHHEDIPWEVAAPRANTLSKAAPFTSKDKHHHEQIIPDEFYQHQLTHIT